MIPTKDIKFQFPTPLGLMPEEFEILGIREHIEMHIWAEQEYVLPETAPLPGPWSNYYTPYLIEPMHRLCAVGQCQVTIISCSQAGKSELTNILIGYTVAQRPGNILVVMPREDDAHTRVNTRIRPMFRKCPNLLRQLPGGRPEGLNAGSETVLKNYMILFLAWSGSPAALSDKSVPIIVLDEVGKYPPKSGREADPVSLAKKRVRAFKGRWKILVASTPVIEDDLIDAEYKKSDMRKWWVKCPHCEDWHLMSWWNVFIEKDENEKFYEPGFYADGKHSRYVCPDCGSLWTEEQRWIAASEGKWCPKNCKVINGKIEGEISNTEHYGYHIHALMLSPIFSTVSDLVQEWVAANKAKHTGDKEPLQDFYNSQLGEAFYEIQAKTDAKIIFEHRGLYRAGFVPDYVQILVNAIDVQLDHFYVMTLGVGYLWQSAIIFYEKLQTGDTKNIENWGPVIEFLKMSFPRKDKPEEKLYPLATAIDCGYNYETVINFCRMITFHRVMPVRGDDKVRAVLWRKNDKDCAPVTRYDLNVNLIKDSVYDLIHQSTIPGSGYMQIPADSRYELAQHLSSEERVIQKIGKHKRSIWLPKDEHHPLNHFWDDTVYAKWLADFLGARMLRDPAEIVKTNDEIKKEVNSKKQIRTHY